MVESTIIIRGSRLYGLFGLFGVSVVALLAVLLVECGWIGGAVVQTRLCLEHDMDMLHHFQMLVDQGIVTSQTQTQHQAIAAAHTTDVSEIEKHTETDSLTQQLELQEERIRQQKLEHRLETEEKEVMSKELAKEVASLKYVLEQLTTETSHLESTVKQNESLHLQHKEQHKTQLESLQDERSHLQHVLGAYTTHLNQLSDAHRKLETTVQLATQQVLSLLSTTTSSSSTTS